MSNGPGRRMGADSDCCKDGEDRWVKLPAATLAALQAHLEAMDLEGSVKRWSPEQRDLAFPNTVGRVTRYGAFFELVWKPLLAAAKLPYRKPHAMRHSYATWTVEAGADLRSGQGPTRTRLDRGDQGHLRPPRTGATPRAG